MRDELEVLATCMDNGENDAPIPGVDNSLLETACLKLAELPEALAIVQVAGRGASDSNRHSRACPGGKGKSRQPFGRQRVPKSARDQRQSDDRPAQVVGRTQRPRPQPQQRRGTELQTKLDKRKAHSVCHTCGQTGHWAGDPQCPGRPVNVIELEDEVQEFEPSQDAGTRQTLSVQVDVSDVRFLRPSTRLVLAVNSIDVGRREGARGVIDTAAWYTVAGRAWDRAYRQICAERGIGHLINVTPESEVYRFGNGGLLTSTERVTVPVVLADHPLLLSYSVVESPVLSLLIGRDVVEGLGLDIKGSSKTLEYSGRSQPLEDSVAGHYCVTLSPEQYAGLLKLGSSPDPPTSRLRPRPTSFVPKSSRSKLASTLGTRLSLCSNNICGQLKSDRNSTADVFDSDKRVELQTVRDASWQDPLTRLGLSVTPQDQQPEAPTALRNQQWRRICHTPSVLVSSLFLLPGRFLSTALGPQFFATGAECVKWSADFVLSVTSRLLDSLMKFLLAGKNVRLWINLDANTPDYRRPISQTIASVLMRRRSLQLLSRLRRFRSFFGFCAVWTFDANSRILQSKHHPEFLEFQRLLPHRITIQTGKSSLVVLSSHQQLLRPLQREAVRSAMTFRRRQISSRACRSANCVSKAGIDYLVQQKVPETLVSEIVRPSPEAAEHLSVSALVAAAATRVRVDPSGDVVMTPTDQAQQDEDANLRKIVAQLHVNLGHPSNDALALAIRLSGGSDDAIQAAFKVRCTVCERLTEPSPVPAASLRRWTEFGQCVALDLFMFADITGEHGLFLNMLDMASHYQVVFPVADKNPLTFFYGFLLGWCLTHGAIFYGFLLGWCLTLGVPECLRFDLGGEFESSLVNWLSKLDVDLPAASVSPTQNAPCERAGGAWKYRARRLVDQFSIKWNDSSTKLWLCAVLNWSTNTAIGDSGHSPSQWVLFLSRASQLASHQRHRHDVAYQRRVAMLAEVQRSIISTRYDKALSRAFLSRSRSANNAPSQVRFAVGDQVMFARKQQAKKTVVNALVGPSKLSLDTKVVQTCGLVIAMPLSRQLETTFDSLKWKSNSRGMIFTIPFVKQRNRHTSISVRLVSRDPQK